MTIEKDDSRKITIPETLTVHVNKKCIAIQTEKEFITYPAEKITEIHKNILRQVKSDNRGQAYDNSSIYIYMGNGSKSIRTGPYTEDVYTFILKNLYELDLENEQEDDSVSTSGYSYARMTGSVYSKD